MKMRLMLLAAMVLLAACSLSAQTPAQTLRNSSKS